MTQRCALWVRISKDEQETGNQLDQLQAWAHRRGLEVAVTYQLDGASAWTGAHRCQLRRALDDARAGRFDILLCWALDRLSREGVEATITLLRQFRERGVLVWSLQESWTETSDLRMAELPSPAGAGLHLRRIADRPIIQASSGSRWQGAANRRIRVCGPRRGTAGHRW